MTSPSRREELNEPFADDSPGVMPSDSDTLQVVLIGVLLAALIFGFVLGVMPGQALS